MTLTILYFAAVRELVGTDEERVDFAGGTVADLAAFLQQHRPALAGRLGSVRFARNEEFAQSGDAVADGDVIALIPPVAGG
ncbi:MAG: molybdopterin converting factor subunit 1 [Labilithrix sp.]